MELPTQKRDVFGRGLKILRAQDLIPAELYGHGTENIHLFVTKKDFTLVLNEAGESTLVDLVVEGQKHPVLIHAIHYHPVTDEVLNVDFYQVKMDEKITTSVELEFVGESPAVKNLGGILVRAVSELEVEALPADLPHDIKVDVSILKEIGDSIQVKDLPISNKVKVEADPETVVTTITAQMTEEEDKAQGQAADLSAIEKEEEKASPDNTSKEESGQTEPADTSKDEGSKE